jgi:hypothetical protein
VVEGIGKTDIGLGVLKDGVSFNNRFLGIEAAPKVWLPSKELNYRDEFVIDGFTTSVQRLTCLSRRIRKENTRGEEFYKANDDTRLPDPGTYIILDQGIMGTGEPEITATPCLREGVCGSAILLARTSRGNTLQNGAIAGFMHWCDLQSSYNIETPPLLCYCDSKER